MMKNIGDMRPGEKGKVIKLATPLNMRRRFLDIGLIENTDIKCVGKSPLGGLSAFLIRGAVIAIRDEDCKTVFISGK